jgi:glycosyltransferase involved in cell wall biosynthesis
MNVPDPKYIHCSFASPKRKNGVSFNLVYFGTIANRLGIDLAIRAVAKLVAKIP